MFYFIESCERLNQGRAQRLCFIGFGIRHPRSGREQIIPNLYNATAHYSLVFNHEPVKISIDGAAGVLPGNTLVVWNQSARVVYGETGARWRLTWLQLYGEEIDTLLRDHGTPLNRPFTFDSERIVNNRWMPICEEFSEYVSLDLPIVRNHIDGILLEIDRLRRNSGGGELRIPEAFREMRDFLDNHYTENITLTGLAKKVHLAPAYFSRRFKEYFGQGPIDYLIALRLHDAALCLRSTELSIREIAGLVGYNDVFHFSKQFKRHFGVAPQLFRDSLLKK